MPIFKCDVVIGHFLFLRNHIGFSLRLLFEIMLDVLVCVIGLIVNWYFLDFSLRHIVPTLLWLPDFVESPPRPILLYLLWVIYFVKYV